MENKILVVAGPTAVGKTEYAIEISNKFNGEIVSCDSMQIYKEMEIGSAKPTLYERKKAVHHMVDIIDPHIDFSVAEYSKMAKVVIEDILNRGKLPVIAGGTGLYLNSILYDMDFANTSKKSNIRSKYEQLAETKGREYVYDLLYEKDVKVAEKIHPNNLIKVIRALEIIELGEKKEDFDNIKNKKSAYSPVLICLNRNREELYERINKRVDIMLEKGLIDELKYLLNLGVSKNSTALRAIGYKELIAHLEKESSLEEACQKIKQNSRRYAKRQLTWFRRYEDMKWFNLSEDNIEDVLKWLEKRV